MYTRARKSTTSIDAIALVVSTIILAYCIRLRIDAGTSIGPVLTFTTMLAFATLVVSFSNIRKFKLHT